MFKLFSLIVLLSTILRANEQIILVISDDFNATTAQLYTYEKKSKHYHRVFVPFSVNLGRNGLGWGEGIQNLQHQENEPQKREGDGRAPSGIFMLGNAFGYEPTSSTKLHYTHADTELICVDDVTNKHYNRVLHVKDKTAIKSYEIMQRKDNLYEIGVMVAHNEKNIPSYGSCIFLHVEKYSGAPTAGCTSMSKEKLSQLIQWLDYDKKPILIQIPALYYNEVLKLYPELLIK